MIVGLSCHIKGIRRADGNYTHYSFNCLIRANGAAIDPPRLVGVH